MLRPGTGRLYTLHMITQNMGPRVRESTSPPGTWNWNVTTLASDSARGGAVNVALALASRTSRDGREAGWTRPSAVCAFRGLYAALIGTMFFRPNV
jgi:hypothetical protein